MKSQLSKWEDTTIHIRRICAIIFVLYAALVTAFYYLAGDQLRFRDSRGNFRMPEAETGTLELTAGTVIEQRFSVPIQRLEAVSVQWGAYYRANSGTITMLLLRGDNGEELARHSFDAADVAEGTVLALSPEQPLETIYDVPLLLRLSSDSAPGSAATPLMAAEEPEDSNFVLRLNGTEASGVLCFSAEGTDYIWTGLHYWKFAAAMGVVLAALLLSVWKRYRSGKRSYVVNALVALKKYRFLIRQLVARDFKLKYKRSVLGVLWSFLNPLLMMLVQYFVFSTLFKSDIPNFAVYLLIGVVMFNFFSEACGMSLTSILGNASLITKVYMPKYIYPLTRTASSAINLLISLLPLIVVCALTGVRLQRATFLALFFLFCLVVFCFGLGLLLSTMMVFFRDTQFLWNVISMMWMYATPIFYPESILPENIASLLPFNPLYLLLKSTRSCILDGVSPEPVRYMQCLLVALGTLLLGAAVFYRNQNKFVLYL